MFFGEWEDWKSQSEKWLSRLCKEADWFKIKKPRSISKLTSVCVWSCKITPNVIPSMFYLEDMFFVSLPHNQWTCCSESLGIRIVFEFILIVQKGIVKVFGLAFAQHYRMLSLWQNHFQIQFLEFCWFKNWVWAQMKSEKLVYQF